MSDQVLYLNRNDTSPMFSRLIQSIKDGKQGKAAPAQWASMIRALTQKGIKTMEIEESGVLTWLETQTPLTPITREELARKLDSLMFTIKEVRLASPRYGSHRQQGGQYAEYLYIANSERDNVVDELEAVDYEMQLLVFEPERLADEPDLVVNLERRRTNLIELKAKAIDFPQHHFSDAVNGRHGKNLLAHCRITQRPEHGLYFIEEIQSDWAQRGRKNNWTQIPVGPLVTNTDAWAGMVLRRHLQLAAKNPAVMDIAWITESMRNGWKQNKSDELQKMEQKKRYDEALKAGVEQSMSIIATEGKTPEALKEARANATSAVKASLARQGIAEPPDMLNEFYLKVIPKIVDKILAGTGEKVSLREITISPGNVVEVPSIRVTDAVRQKLADRQPVYSHAMLLKAPRPVDDQVLLDIVRNASQQLGSAKHLHLASHLYDISTGRKVAGRYINGLVQVSLSAKDIDEACDHECWHFAEERLLTQQEVHTVHDAFAPGTPLNEEVRRILTARGDFALAKECLVASESAAQGFALWKGGQLEIAQDQPAQGIFADLFNAIKDVVKWIRREALDQKLQTPEDVFKAFASGDIAQRQAEFEQSQQKYRSMA